MCQTKVASSPPPSATGDNGNIRCFGAYLCTRQVLYIGCPYVLWCLLRGGSTSTTEAGTMNNRGTFKHPCPMAATQVDRVDDRHAKAVSKQFNHAGADPPR